MDASFILPKEWGFRRENVLPDTYRGFILQGAKVISATGESGTIIFQTFEQPLFTIRYKFLEFFQKAKIPFKQNHSSLVSFLALKNDISYKIKGLGLMKVPEGNISLLRANQPEFNASFEKNKIYQSLEISWSEEILKEYVPHFSLIDEILKQEERNKSFFVGNTSQPASHKLLDLAFQILNSPYDAAMSEVSFQHKTREYFFLVMIAIGRIPAKGLKLTEEEWRKIDLIAALLRTQPDKKFPIARLSSNAQMNPTKLKEAFKEKYDCGIFEYQMEWRMKEAMRLLEETNLNQKEISSRVGYKTLPSFITKFREYYGYPPGKVLRKYL